MIVDVFFSWRTIFVTSVVPGGFEPPQTEPKSVVLPLHNRTIVVAKIHIFFLLPNFFSIRSFRKCKGDVSFAQPPVQGVGG